MNKKNWQKAKDIFNDALDLSTDQRAKFLSEKCGKDVELLEEVTSLLRSHIPSFLETVPEVFAEDKILKLLTDRLSIGQKVGGRYLILKKLGKGGMGEVYLAKDLKLNRLIALKVLNKELSQDKHQLEQFEKEARAAASIDNPYIIRIIDYKEADSISFITTEFFQGENLRQKINTSKLDIETILQITGQVASALKAAHEKNIIHSDIKPENIMIDKNGLVKILDFGIAKLIERESTESEAAPISSARSETILSSPGTTNYMSPEQIRGEEIDARSDIWSLGVCLYEMLTSKKTFAEKTEFETIAAILYKPHPDLLSQDIPAAVKNIIEKSLQKKREDRYQTIDELCSALANIKDNDSETLQNSNVGMNTFNEWRKTHGKPIWKRLLLGVILCLVISLVCAVSFSNLLNTTYSDKEIAKAEDKLEKDRQPTIDEREKAKIILNESGKESSDTEINDIAKSLAVRRIAYEKRIKTAAETFQVSASFFHLILIAIAFLYYRNNLGPTGFHDIKKDEEADGSLKSSIKYSTGYEDISSWETARNIATTALKDYRDVFVLLLTAWAILYFILILNFFNQDNNLIIALLAQANNFNTICLWLCFRILNEPISTGSNTSDTREIIIKSSFQGQPFLYISIFMGMFIWFILEFKLTSVFENNADIFHAISELVSGLFGGIAMAVFVGRFQSKFLKSPEPLIFLLYLYTVIQSLFLFFGSNSVESNFWTAGIIQMALFLKCLLILYTFWLFQSGRLLFYLVRVRRADKQVDSEWENFPEVLEKQH